MDVCVNANGVPSDTFDPIVATYEVRDLPEPRRACAIVVGITATLRH
jgi:hypothetical protein